MCVVACSACCLQACICVAGAALGHSVRCLCRRRASVSCRGVFRLLSPGLHVRGRGSTWAVCLLSVSPASVCVVACRGVFRLLSRLAFAWQGQHLGSLSVVRRRRPRVSWHGGVFRLLSPLAFAWQGQHLGSLSVVCVAGLRVCRGVSWRVPLAVSRLAFAWHGQRLGSLLSVSPASVCVVACRGVFRLLSLLDLRVAGTALRRPVCCLRRRRVTPCRGVFRLLSLLDLRGRGSTLASCLSSVSPATTFVTPCRGVFRLLSLLDLRGRRSTLGVLSVVCVASVRVSYVVSLCVPLPLSAGGRRPMPNACERCVM